MLNRFFSTINKYPITVTSKAWKKIGEILTKQNSPIFLFSASSGGCNGFNYELQLLDETRLTEYKQSNIQPTILENKNSKLLIDPLSEILLMGTTIDYEYENYENGIFESKFIFLSDKSLVTSCGCGVSFTPKD